MPSVHKLVTGFYEPNIIDTATKAGNDFGSTIAIMAQDLAKTAVTDECSNGASRETEAAQ